jgi:four helix bundle protein
MQDTTYPFPHDRLQAFQVALEMAAQAKVIADGIPRGYRSLADQLMRAASSVVLNIGEGANRTTSGAKRQRYSEARGEAGEVAANARLLTTLAIVPTAAGDTLIHLSGRVAAMLTRLVASVA